MEKLTKKKMGTLPKLLMVVCGGVIIGGMIAIALLKYNTKVNIQEQCMFDNVSDELSAPITSTISLKREDKGKKRLKMSDNVASKGQSRGSGDPKARVVSKGVMGIVSGKIKGAKVSNADPFGKGGFSSDLNALLSGTGGLKRGGGSGVGRAGAAGVGFGSGYGSGFGGGSGGVGNLIGGMGSQTSSSKSYKMKKRARINASGRRSQNYASSNSGYTQSKEELSQNINNSENEIQRLQYKLAEMKKMEKMTPQISCKLIDTKKELSFIKAADNAVSTFSIDVDKGSYSQVRNYITQGSLPPTSIVRTEELINYFNYDYKQPKGKHPVLVNTELGVAPWNNDNLLLKVGLKAKEVSKRNMPNSNFVFLIDVSGSMSSRNKLPLLKRSFKLLSENLRKRDRVSIVVYAGAAGVVLEPTSGNYKNKINRAFDQLSAGGSTAGGQGIMLAYKLARENFIKGGNNRVILATDGDFNVGASSNSELIKLIKARRDDGIYLTVMGFGSGNYQDKKMEQLADKGNGNYYYIDNFLEAKKTLQTEFMGTMYTVAKDVKLQLEFNPKNVKSYRLIGYDNRILAREDFNDDKKDAGEMGAGHTVTALYEIIPNNNSDLRYGANKKSHTDELLFLKLRYKKPDQNKSRLLKHYVKTGDMRKRNSVDFNFAASVTAFSELLMNRSIGNFSYDDVEELARESKGKDRNGYRAEFINLVTQIPNVQPRDNRNRVSHRNERAIISNFYVQFVQKLNNKNSLDNPIAIGADLGSDEYVKFTINSKGEVKDVKLRTDEFNSDRDAMITALKEVNFGDIPFGKNSVKIPLIAITKKEVKEYDRFYMN